MKGTFFSADYVRDSNDDLRLIEINTDTGAVNSQKSIFDWTDFISVLESNNITKLDVIYKYDIQSPIVETLSSSIATNAPFITNYNETIVPNDSIFPTSPVDEDGKFILRLAYDETAILDSEYAKGTLNLLKLFTDAGDSGSVIGFYHSSSVYGEYNTINTTLANPSNVPDLITKTVTELHSGHSFYKIGHSESASIDRLNDFIATTATPDLIFEEYHFSQDASLAENKVDSQRTFQIVYGPDLDLCYVAEFEVASVFELPTAIEVDDTTISNKISSKHYYEFATNHIKNNRHGLLGDTKIIDVDGNGVEIQDVAIGNTYKSYYVEGAPNTDDEDTLRTWKHVGAVEPEGSFATSSICINKITMDTFATELTRLTFDNGDSFYIGGESRVLAYNIANDYISYERVLNLEPNTYGIYTASGSYATITGVDCVLFDEPQLQYTLNMEDVDNYILEVGGGVTAFFIVHNLIGSCFVAGTTITMVDGTTKNIEDVVEGDIVLSYNETTKEKEGKVVIGTKQPIHNDIVKYTLSNGKTITSTFDHPFYTNELQLASFAPQLTNERYELGRNVIKIKQGDVLYTTPNENEIGLHAVAVQTIEPQPTEDVQTYIITVADNHNFFANEILVHNK